MEKNRIDVITMGCSKNLVDSERLIRRLEAKGYSVSHDPEEASGEYVVVNTCGFIGDAKEESIEMILGLADRKSEETIGKLIVMGCLSQRYLNELDSEIPEVDQWYGKFDWNAFVESLPDVSQKPEMPKEWERRITGNDFSAFLKISEGCNRFCAFCAIPLITGRHKSRPEEEIIEEVKSLVAKGVKEFNIIAQDLSSYGLDLYGEHRLASIVDKISRVDGVEWIRLHYAYPADFPYDVLDVMRERPNVCKYLDIALQHISDNVLENMDRRITGEETRKLLKTIRERVPGIKLRTTLMVGFPGEGVEQYKQLLEFVREERFERLGAFAYCEEDDTKAKRNFEDAIPEDVKQERLNHLIDIQEDICMEQNEALIGTKMRVLVTDLEYDEDGEFIGSLARSEFDSPDVDHIIHIEGLKLPVGEFAEVVITDALPYDLTAKIFQL